MQIRISPKTGKESGVFVRTGTLPPSVPSVYQEYVEQALERMTHFGENMWHAFFFSSILCTSFFSLLFYVCMYVGLQLNALTYIHPVWPLSSLFVFDFYSRFF